MRKRWMVLGGLAAVIGGIWLFNASFLARMRAAGSEVVIVGTIDLRKMSFTGIDDADQLATIPKDWRGGVATNAIDRIGPHAAHRAQ